MDTAERTTSRESSTVYDGFISYSHAADDLLAPRLQSALQRFAKPWWKRRALRIFRDESSLSANPHLWSSITDALDQSGWFVLLLSPDAASSEWVNQEIEYWKEHKDPTRILPVLTDGTFEWRADDVSGTAVPDQLRGSFSEEPRWVDMRFARDETDLDLKDPRFADAVADIASALRGVPKDELASEEVKQHRRTIRTAWAAGFLVLILGVAAVFAAIRASQNATEAERQAEIAEENAALAAQNEQQALAEAERADSNAEAEVEARIEADRQAQLAAARALAASSIAVLEDDPELSTLLAIQAISETPEGIEQPSEVINALWRAGSSNRLTRVFPTETGSQIALSDDGSKLVVSENRRLRMLDAATGEQIWFYTEETLDFFSRVDIGPDGRIALAILNSNDPGAPVPTGEQDGSHNRVLILDGATADVIETLEYPECSGAGNPAWSPDGRYLAVSSGSTSLSQERTTGCPREGTAFWIEVFETDGWSSVAFQPMGGSSGPRPVWDDNGFLHGMAAQSNVAVLEPESFEPLPPTGASGIGQVSPDGSRYVVGVPDLVGGNPFNAFLIDASTGTFTDVIDTDNTRPSIPNGIEITKDGALAVIGTGSHIYIYEVATSENLYRLASGDVLTSAYDPITQRLYTSGSDPGILVWDLRTSTTGVQSVADLGRFSFVNGNSFEVGPAFLSMDTVDFGSNFQRRIQLLDPQTGDLGPELIDHVMRGPLANGKWIVSQAMEDETTYIWDPETDRQIEILGCDVPVVEVGTVPYCSGENEPRWWLPIAAPDGRSVLAWGSSEITTFRPSDHFLRFDSDTGEILESVEPGNSPSSNDPLAGFTGVPISTSRGSEPIFFMNDHVFIRGSQELVAYDRATGELLFRRAGAGGSLELSSYRGLVAFSGGGSVTLLDTAEWEEVVQIPTVDRVRGLGFNSDGSRLAIGELGTLRVVDTETGQAVQEVALTNVSDIHWIDDETLLVGTGEGIVGTVSLSTDIFLDTVRAELRRTFTERECALYKIDPCPTLEEIRSG